VRLEHVDGSSDERSPTCGSTVRTDVQLDEAGRVMALSQQVQACAFGQASAAILQAGAIGRSTDDVRQAADDLGAWLAGERHDPGQWPGLKALEPARSRRSRHGAILLPFRALLSAMRG